MIDKIQKICGKIIEKYSKDQNVLGILLFGSAARGKFDEFSDIDILILLTEKPEFARENFIIDGTRADIILHPISDVRCYLRLEKFQVHRNFTHMIAHGKIIYEKTKDLEKIIQLSKKNLNMKTKYSSDEILMHLYSIDDFFGGVQRAVKRKDIISYANNSYLMINNAIELVLKKNGKYWLAPDELSNLLSNYDKKILMLIQNFYQKSDLISQLDVLAQIVKYVNNLTNGGLPQSWKTIE